MGGYAGFPTRRYLSRSQSSWDDAGWRALLLQRFEHVAAADDLVMPATTDRHLWLVTEGAGRMRIDFGDGWRDAPIAPGQVTMAVPGRPVRIQYETTAPMRSIHVHLAADTVQRAATELGGRPEESAPPPDGPERDLLGALLRSLAAAQDRGADDLYAQTAAEFLAAHLVTATGRPAGRASGGDASVWRAVAVMRDRLAEPVRLADLAAEARLSPFHFLRVFKRVTGSTPGRYLTRLRIEHAQRLLDRGLTVEEAARACGYGSPGHLSTAFLRETGMRPSAYRRR